MSLDGEPPVNTGDALRHFIKIAAGAVLVFGFYSIPAALLRVFSLTQRRLETAALVLA
jgi:hypothetical protein